MCGGVCGTDICTAEREACTALCFQCRCTGPHRRHTLTPRSTSHSVLRTAPCPMVVPLSIVREPSFHTPIRPSAVGSTAPPSCLCTAHNALLLGPLRCRTKAPIHSAGAGAANASFGAAEAALFWRPRPLCCAGEYGVALGAALCGDGVERGVVMMICIG